MPENTVMVIRLFIGCLFCLTLASCVTREVAMSAAREAGASAVDRALIGVMPPPGNPWTETAIGSMGAAVAVIGHRYWYHKRKADK